MLSVSAIRSSSGASTYFAADNYYSQPDTSISNQWHGNGAERLGLQGEVTPEALEAIFDGVNPATGERITPDNTVRKGLDLTFNAPKGVSLLALEGGDTRLLQAQETAVTRTMAYIEKNFAQARVMKDGVREVINTKNLTYAAFTHDTNRNQEEHLHTHVTIANMTQTPEGHWKALHNDAIWKNNTLFGSRYNAELNQLVRDLGYETHATGNYAQFDITGVPEHITALNSTRTAEISQRAEALGVRTPEGRNIVVLDTRNAKEPIADRAAWLQSRYEKNLAAGFDARAFVETAREASQSQPSILSRLTETTASLRERFGPNIDPSDPRLSQSLVDRLFKPIETLRTEWAVASAINKLSEREAVFTQADVIKTALGFREAGVTPDRVDQRLAELHDKSLILTNGRDDPNHPSTRITTPESLLREQQVIASFMRGRGEGQASLSPVEAQERLLDRQAQQAGVQGGIVLNAGQMVAAKHILSSPDRFVAVQGDAGTGKSTMVQAVSEIQQMVAASLPDSNKTVVGLASYNAMVKDLGESAKIESYTIQSFLHRYENIARYGSEDRQAEARAELTDKIFVVDESSVVGTRAMHGLVTIAEKLNIEKMGFIGDRYQLAAIAQGKLFAVGQDSALETRRMSENIRQSGSPTLVEVASLAREGQFGAAFDLLGSNFREDKDFVARGVEHYLSMPVADRLQTMLIVPGRALKDEVNVTAQEMLRAEGALTGPERQVSVLEQISKTREDLRYPNSYREGMVFENARDNAGTGLPAGSYSVTDVSKTHVTLVDRTDGTIHTINPRGFSTNDDRFQAGLYIAKSISIHEGEKIRWTNNDHKQELFRSTEATITKIDGDVMTVSHKVDGQDVEKTVDLTQDKMGEYFDLAYAINADQAQGATATNVIALMTAEIRALASRANAYVMMTREKDNLWVYTDDRDRLEKVLEASQPEKTASVELMNGGPLDADAAEQLRQSLDEAKLDEIDRSLKELEPQPAASPDLPDAKMPDPTDPGKLSEQREAATNERPPQTDGPRAPQGGEERAPDREPIAPAEPASTDAFDVGHDDPFIREVLKHMPERTRDMEI
jgi:conjugative relaxase-like TrwC/TraI family protein